MVPGVSSALVSRAGGVAAGSLLVTSEQQRSPAPGGLAEPMETGWGVSNRAGVNQVSWSGA